MKYSEIFSDWLIELGYDHCFFVGGGNIMHLIESISIRMQCTPVIHEVAAGIAAEYYNETSEAGKAFALVTAGPGLTNIITALAGAFLESRELLVIGGQVKTTDLALGEVRQRGIQEIDGVSISKPITKTSALIMEPISFNRLNELVDITRTGRKGPVFLEIPLDVQAKDYPNNEQPIKKEKLSAGETTDTQVLDVASLLKQSQRPVFLLGGGITRACAAQLLPELARCNIPVATTWNGADRIGSEEPIYIGRPNTWGQRSANLILQQADLLVALGARLGLQQTGFNWQEFLPLGETVQVDIDQCELDKSHPDVKYKICGDANYFLQKLVTKELGKHDDWMNFTKDVRSEVPLIEDVNITNPNYISPYNFVDELSNISSQTDLIIPCSSGGAFTTMMQTFQQKNGQKIISNKGLASMGYGLSGAIGAAFSSPGKRVILVEGDGGFAQNLQELGTAKINELNIKIFIFNDSGYASIRMTQKNYFGGKYVGCDRSTGLGLPHWESLFASYKIPTFKIDGTNFGNDSQFAQLFENEGPVGFIVNIDPEQTYLPKIMSRVTKTGSMVSNPLHIMSPDLTEDVKKRVEKYFSAGDEAPVNT